MAMSLAQILHTRIVPSEGQVCGRSGFRERSISERTVLEPYLQCVSLFPQPLILNDMLRFHVAKAREHSCTA